jgi:hypothetical protein
MSVEHIPMRLSRDDVSEDEWRDLCQAQGLYADADGIVVAGRDLL